MRHSTDFEKELKELELQRNLLQHELAQATTINRIQTAEGYEQKPGFEMTPATRSIPEITADIVSVDTKIEATLKDLEVAKQELLSLSKEEEELKRIENLKDLAENLTKTPELPPQLTNEVGIPQHDLPGQVIQNLETASPLEVLAVNAAILIGTLTSKAMSEPEKESPAPPTPTELAMERAPTPAEQPPPPVLESTTYELPGNAAFPPQPPPILVVEQRVQTDLDPALKERLDSIDETFAKKQEVLEEKIDQLQERFDDRQKDRDPEEKARLQQALDKEFEALREQLARAEAQERQRALDEHARQIEAQRQTERVQEFQHNRDDALTR